MALSLLNRFGINASQLPKEANSESGKLLIVGGARCVWDDLSQVNVTHYDVMCINDIGVHLPVWIEHWYSNHADCLPWWKTCRAFHYGDVLSREKPDLFKMHSCFGGKIKWPSDEMARVVKWPWPGHGSSGLNAAYTGLGLGYENILLAGLPYDNDGHYFDAPEGHSILNERNKWIKFAGFRKLWEQARDHIFEGRVRSLSGVTKDVLG